MWTAKWILDAYEEGEEPVRFDLYMAYPDLRSYFDEIEARSNKAVLQLDDQSDEKAAKAWWFECCRLVRG
jgi:hypothetical protein